MTAMSKGSSRTGRPPDGKGRLLLVMVASIALSLAGIAYAVFWGVAADGGRGGALAVALTFIMLFVGRGTRNPRWRSGFRSRDREAKGHRRTRTVSRP